MFSYIDKRMNLPAWIVKSNRFAVKITYGDEQGLLRSDVAGAYAGTPIQARVVGQHAANLNLPNAFASQ